VVNSQTEVFRLINLLRCTEMLNSACSFFVCCFVQVLPIIFGGFILVDLGSGTRFTLSEGYLWLIYIHTSQVDGQCKGLACDA